LALSFIPVAIVVVLMWRWHLGLGRSFHAIARMLLQLTLIGYVLIYIFQAESGLIICGVLAVMLVAASWVALNTVDLRKTTLFPASLVSVLLGGGTTLLLITQGVLQLDPWYQPSYMIPLAGMIFAASMTNISLAVERLHAELENGRTFERARDIAFRASTGHDDRTNSFRGITAGRSALSDNGDVHDFWCSRTFYRVFLNTDSKTHVSESPDSDSNCNRGTIEYDQRLNV